jgi:uncharacterized protein (DUF4415 family)
MSKKSKQTEEMKQLAQMTEKDIDTGDAPEVKDWRGAERSRFFRPVKQQITLRIDADLIDWFKSHGNKYQTSINAALRDYVEHHS